MSTRRATHAGSWYSSSPSNLNGELTTWLAAAKQDRPDFPMQNVRAVIAPHAGYSYSGPAAAYAYASIDVTAFKRVFILGPSHHYYLDGCALSACDEYETPLGNLKIDSQVVNKLKATKEFGMMSINTDEDEHSIEMHLPYIRKIFEGRDDLLIIPILIGAISTSTESHFGALLAPYLEDPSNLFVTSTDFCHWGTRFNYTYYLPPPPATEGYSLGHPNAAGTGKKEFEVQPIWKSIEQLDRLGMDTITTTTSESSGETVIRKDAHKKFAAYLKKTKNTICGRHPIGVLLAALGEGKGEVEGKGLEWTRYEQSSQVKNLRESSVSYVSGVVTA